MSMTQYSGETEVISKLGTTPQERGLSTEQFKAKFDEGLKGFVEWFNNTHKTQFDAKAETTSLNALQNEVSAHLAEIVSQQIHVTRDLAISGIQTISTLNKDIKSISAIATVNATKHSCISLRGQNGKNVMLYADATADNNRILESPSILIMFSSDNSLNRTRADITNIQKGSFDLNWVVNSGTGVVGTAVIGFLITYHGE